MGGKITKSFFFFLSHVYKLTKSFSLYIIFTWGKATKKEQKMANIYLLSLPKQSCQTISITLN